MSKNENKVSPMVKISSFIVDKRNGFILIYIIACITSIFSSGWTKVNEDITSYLKAETEIRKGLNVSDREFKTYGVAEIMVSNITYKQGKIISETIEKVEGVESVIFDESEEHYKAASALYMVNFLGADKDKITQNAMDEILDHLSGYDLYVNSSVTEDMAAALQAEMGVVMIIAMVIILSVMIFTSRTYMEIPVLIITFGVAALLNIGSHFLLGEISFVSNSIAVVLQLALGVDYAIILCHRFTEEREHLEARDAAVIALSKAIPEVSSSSMTTISGLMALMFMQFQIGMDMGVVLIKAILFSLLSVFTLMPGLLVIFSGLMDKTVHMNFVPSIEKWGLVIVKTRIIVPVVFILGLLVAFYISNQTNYVYGYTTLETIAKNDIQIAKEKISETFGKDNLIGIIVPSGNYEQEGRMIKALEEMPIMESVIGLANTSGPDDYYITDQLTPRQFTEMTDMDIEQVEILYSAYAVNDEKYSRLINGLSEYKIPIIDMFMYIYKQKEEGYIKLEESMEEEIDDAYKQLKRGKDQLESEAYSRILLVTNLPEEGEETLHGIKEIKDITSSYYDECYYIGESISTKDLGESFAFDNILISVLSAFFVMMILMFTFRSSGLPVLLVLCIQGSIWMNFSFPPIQDVNIFFLSYLVVTSIQMGATIDYAIVITSRYMELKKTMSINDAISKSVDQAFPTIVTSGTILASAGVLIGRLSSDYAVASIGTCLGRGTIISIIIVMGVLPQILLTGTKLIDRTAFELRRLPVMTNQSGNMKLNGRVKGWVNGYVDGTINGTLKGEVNGVVNADNQMHLEVIDEK